MTALRILCAGAAMLIAAAAPVHAKPATKKIQAKAYVTAPLVNEDCPRTTPRCGGAAAAQASQMRVRSTYADVPPAPGGWPPLVARARQYLGQSASQIGLHRATLWCSAFMRFIAGTPPGVDDRAKSWLTQRHVAGHVGAIAVVRSVRMHVGVVSGFDSDGDPILISGNHNNRVREAVYPRSSVVAYVEPAS